MELPKNKLPVDESLKDRDKTSEEVVGDSTGENPLSGLTMAHKWKWMHPETKVTHPILIMRKEVERDSGSI